MKLEFDPNQQFQLDAIEAITDLFEGQPQGAAERVTAEGVTQST